MFTYQLINHPESFILDESRIARVFELVSIVPPVSVTPTENPVKYKNPHSQSSIQRKTGEILSSSILFESSFLQNGILNIAFLSDDAIQLLNRDHRGIDKTTDVLSFHYYDDFSDINSDDIAGEIILSESRILMQAIEHQHPSQRECEILILHSLLHIIGYDHETDEDYARMWYWEGYCRQKLV